MDDLRSRYRVERRDFGGPPRRPVLVTPVPHRPHHPPEPPAPPPAAGPPARHVTAPAHHPASARPHRWAKKHRLLKFFVLLLVLAALGGGGFYAYHKYSLKNPFPADIRQASGIDMLYPTKLPAGYQVDPTTIQRVNDILVYKAVNGDQKLVFTLQKTPSTFDFNAFYKQQFKNLQQLDTTYGHAVIGQNSGRQLGSLVDGGTWLLLSTNSSAPTASDYTLILKNIKRY